MRKLLMLIMMSFSLNGLATLNCGEEGFGDAHWFNPLAYELEVTELNDNEGGDCGNQIVVNQIQNFGTPEYNRGYLVRPAVVADGLYSEYFVIDVTELLEGVGNRSWVKIFQLDMVSKNTSTGSELFQSETELVNQNMFLLLEKAYAPHSNELQWKISVTWSDMGDPAVSIEEDLVWINGDAESGVISFHVNWTRVTATGANTTLVINSNTKNASGQSVDMEFPGAVNESVINSSFVAVQSPFINLDNEPSEVKLGILDSNVQIREGSGIQIYTIEN